MKDKDLKGKCGSCLYYHHWWKHKISGDGELVTVKPLARGECTERNVYKWRTETCKKYIKNTWYNRVWRKIREIIKGMKK